MGWEVPVVASVEPGGASWDMLLSYVGLCGIDGSRAGRRGSDKIAAIVCMSYVSIDLIVEIPWPWHS